MADYPRKSPRARKPGAAPVLPARLSKGLMTLSDPVDPLAYRHALPARRDAVPPSKSLSLGMMAETNGGSSLENVPGFNLARARSVDLLPRSVVPEPDRPQTPGGFVAENVIGDIDSLAMVPDVTAIPWRCIAMLSITYQNGARATGTAWFMGPRALGTAGHNIHHQDYGRATEILVSPGFTGSMPAFETYRVAQTYCDPAWLGGTNDPALDYGVLLLEDATVGQRLGWFGFAAYEDGQLARMLINVSGYPGRYYSRAQHYNGGRIKNATRQFLHYTFDTVGGMSGAPLFALFDQQRIVVGIHTSGSDIENRARRIDRPLYDLLARFAAS